MGVLNAPIAPKVNTMTFVNDAAPDESRPEDYIAISRVKIIAIDWPEHAD